MATLPRVIRPGDPFAPGNYGFVETMKSGVEDWDTKAGKLDIERVFIGPWANREAFIFQFIPHLENRDGTLFYIWPPPHPIYPYIYAETFHIEGSGSTGIDAPTRYIAHEFATVTIKYASDRFDAQNNGGGKGGHRKNPNDYYVQEDIASSSEIASLDGTKIVSSIGETDNGITDVPVKIPVILTVIHYNLTFPVVYQPTFIWANKAFSGINSDTFITPSGLHATPGTLRFDGISGVTKRELFGGQLIWSITYHFAYKSIGWNFCPAIKDGKVQIVPFDTTVYINKLAFNDLYTGF